MENARLLTDELHTIRADWKAAIKARRGAMAWRIADLLLRRPVVNAAVIASEVGIAPQNTYRSLERLIEAGVVVEFTANKRHRMWRAPAVLDALDRFAARAGRRSRAGADVRVHFRVWPAGAPSMVPRCD